MRYSTSNLHREIFPVNERANYTSMSEKSLPPHGDYEMSLQPRSHNEYQPQNPQKANSPYHLSNGAASLLRLVTIADSTASTDRKSTRMNSSPLMRISYAVFCLKKKNN